MSKKNGPLTFNDDGTVDWKQRPFDRYIVTGVLANGKRFKPIKTDNWAYASAINLYRGSKWLERHGRRYRIMSVYN